MTTQIEPFYLQEKENYTFNRPDEPQQPLKPKQPHFGNCCCCSIRSGNLVIGWAYIVESISVLVVMFAAHFTFNAGEDLPLVAGFRFWVQIAFVGITIPVYSLILVGVYKKKPIYLKTFVCINSILVIRTFFFQIFEMIYTGFLPMAASLTAVNIALKIIAVFIVDSYRIQLTNEKAVSPVPLWREAHPLPGHYPALPQIPPLPTTAPVHL